VATFKRQSDVPGRWSDELAAPRGEIVAGPAPQVAGSSVDRRRYWPANGPGSLQELTEAEGLGSDLAVEGIGVELGQRCTVAHEPRSVCTPTELETDCLAAAGSDCVAVLASLQPMNGPETGR
jgi:hypothetical protein